MSSVPGSDDASSPLRLASGDVESTTTRPRFLAARELVKRNVGLLLILAAQAFFSLMNAFVKKLQAIDPPVSTFEVRISLCIYSCPQTSLRSVDPSPNGVISTIVVLEGWLNLSRL